jgi:hypothetical protein
MASRGTEEEGISGILSKACRSANIAEVMRLHKEEGVSLNYDGVSVRREQTNNTLHES